jgi:hypothetical protein
VQCSSDPPRRRARIGKTAAAIGGPSNKANRDVLTGALQTAWRLRVDKNAAARPRKHKRQHSR